MFNHSRIPRHMLLEQPSFGVGLWRRLVALFVALLLGVGVGIGVSEAQQDVRSTCNRQTH